MTFPEERYELIEELVAEYQNGDRNSAGEKLIALFEPLFNKYVKIIKRGIIDFNDFESRHFLSLFIADPKTRVGLTRHYQSKKTREMAHKTLYVINNACTQMFEEDLHQELIVIFLKFIINYKAEHKCFCAYINTSYGFGVANSIKKVLSNPISTSILTDFNDDFSELYEAAIIDDVCLDDILPTSEIEELNNSWIYGLTCSNIFSDLTPFERMILKMSYLDRISDGEIAKKVGFHRNSIWLKRNAAIDKIKRKSLELKIVDDNGQS